MRSFATVTDTAEFTSYPKIIRLFCRIDKFVYNSMLYWAKLVVEEATKIYLCLG